MIPQQAAIDRRHIDYFDPIRITAAFGVIFLHAANAPLRLTLGPGLQWNLLTVCVCFAFTSVPLFLMMSGYLILSSSRTADIRYHLTKRLPRLVVPLCFWTVTALLEVQLSQHIFTPARFLDGLVESFRTPAMVYLWYMYLLVALYLLSPILSAALRSLDRSGHRYVLLLIGAVTLQAMLTAALPPEISRWLDFDVFDRLKLYSGNLCTFLLGWYLGGAKGKIPNRYLILAGLGLMAAIAAGTLILAERDMDRVVVFVNQSAGFEVALAGCIFLLWKQNCRVRAGISRFLRPVAALSFPIYLMHGVLLTVVDNLGLGAQGLLGTFRVSALIFLACLLCMKTAASFRPFCFLICGLRYEDACQSCNWQYTIHALRKNPKGDH